ncbi:MAG TPA: ammonia-forming cytochrome c nitrite reductase subunit c552 [bacterium]|nr:ammonia-forming cytochrome c nitrite reductase subunit c552 [bacterium]
MLTRSDARLWQAARAAGIALLLFGFAFASGASAQTKKPATPAMNKAKSTCVDCHSDPKFLVQNKKLYDYYQAYKDSIHAQSGVTCSDCHGGNPKAATEAAAHGTEALSSANKASPINYRNIPATCAKCHKKIYQMYRQSAHFEHLKAAAPDEQGPNCVTCHGSLNVSVLTVNNVRTTCQQCHNEKTGNNPDIPAHAQAVLNNFLSIDRYYRFIARHSKPEDAKPFFDVVDPVIKQLTAEWHTFDIDSIDEKTHDLVQFMKVRRNDLLNQERRKRQ